MLTSILAMGIVAIIHRSMIAMNPTVDTGRSTTASLATKRTAVRKRRQSAEPPSTAARNGNIGNLRSANATKNSSSNMMKSMQPPKPHITQTFGANNSLMNRAWQTMAVRISEEAKVNVHEVRQFKLAIHAFADALEDFCDSIEQAQAEIEDLTERVKELEANQVKPVVVTDI